MARTPARRTPFLVCVIHLISQAVKGAFAHFSRLSVWAMYWGRVDPYEARFPES